MHRPVVAALRVLARAVERIDDPDPLPRLPVGSARIALFGEQPVVGALRSQHAAEPFVGDRVPGLAELAPLDSPLARVARSISPADAASCAASAWSSSPVTARILANR